VKERSKKKKTFTQLSLHCCAKRAKKNKITQVFLHCCATRAGQTRNNKKKHKKLGKAIKGSETYD